MSQNILYWFTNDLRLHDNPGLRLAAKQADRLVCLYCVNPAWFKPNRYTNKRIAQHRWGFLLESLRCLDAELQTMGQCLHVHFQNPQDAIAELVTQQDIRRVYRSRTADFYLLRYWQNLCTSYRSLQFTELDSHTLFEPQTLPFNISELPATFTQFRKSTEELPLPQPLDRPHELPPGPIAGSFWSKDLPPAPPVRQQQFHGGERSALQQLTTYFDQQHPAHYKHVRNELDGWFNSTKFSPWLANGSLSARYIMKTLRAYEKKVVQNDSTYWIFLELLWREYFQWYAHCHGKRLFLYSGINGRKPSSGFYPERFRKWCAGNTPYAIVNACMKQLNATGYMSNRGRQIVASCLVNELDSDWRCGAAYFEQQLIDYDVASNWGNWQYLGGVGADPRGKRHFDLEKQTQQYDPEGRFIQTWQGGGGASRLDSVDAADWPIMPDD